jgi:hypothetical protein
MKKLLFIYLLMQQLLVLPAEPKKEAKISAEGESSAIDCFDLIKQKIAASKYRITNWDECPLESPEMEERSECGLSSGYIVQLFTGLEDPWQRYNDLLEKIASGQHFLLTQHEYFDSYNNFFKQKENAYENIVANQLFADAKKPEHLIFFVVFFTGGHTFVIEKLSDGKLTWWRIYESWYKQHTLGQWVGIDAWKENVPKIVTELFNMYGLGKKIIKKELILEFFKKIYDNLTKDLKVRKELKETRDYSDDLIEKIELYVRSYDLGLNFCKNLQSQLAQEAELQARTRAKRPVKLPSLEQPSKLPPLQGQFKKLPAGAKE